MQATCHSSTHMAYTSKKTYMTMVSPTTAPPGIVIPEPVVPADRPEEKRSCPQVCKSLNRSILNLMHRKGASVMMEMFSAHFNDLQAGILGSNHSPLTGTPCACGSGDNQLYCCEECFHFPTLCRRCIVTTHIQHPFHHIQLWTGTHFSRISLSAAGFSLALGHNGHPCPNRISGPGRMTTIVHTNGVHQLRVLYCHCGLGCSDGLQLVKAHLFPATMEKPETTFTFAVLKNLHIHGLTSKKSTYDYFNALQRLTNNTFPQTVPVRMFPPSYPVLISSQDCYWEMLRVSRVWQHLAIVRCSGQSHGIDTILAHRNSGSLTVRCPACPEVGFNVDKSTIDQARDDEWYVPLVGLHKSHSILSLATNIHCTYLRMGTSVCSAKISKTTQMMSP